MKYLFLLLIASCVHKYEVNTEGLGSTGKSFVEKTMEGEPPQKAAIAKDLATGFYPYAKKIYQNYAKAIFSINSMTCDEAGECDSRTADINQSLRITNKKLYDQGLAEMILTCKQLDDNINKVTCWSILSKVRQTYSDRPLISISIQEYNKLCGCNDGLKAWTDWYGSGYYGY